VLPELDRLAVEGDTAAGRMRDGFERSVEVLDRMADRLPGQERLAWAALFCEAGPAAARTALDRLRVASREREIVCLLIAHAQVVLTSASSDAEVRRFMGHLPAELMDELLVLREVRASLDGGDAVVGEAALHERILAQRRSGVPLSLGDLAIDGRDLQETLGIPEGPLIGRILDALLADVLDDPSLNGRVPLLTRAGLLLDGLMQGGSEGAP
jgi:tRNA nucleotidyltransferase (CCA-adding enzyme)